MIPYPVAKKVVLTTHYLHLQVLKLKILFSTATSKNYPQKYRSPTSVDDLQSQELRTCYNCRMFDKFTITIVRNHTCETKPKTNLPSPGDDTTTIANDSI